MERPAGDASLHAPLTEYEDAPYTERTRRGSRAAKCTPVRLLPWVILALCALVLLLSIPGGLGVLICASHMRLRTSSLASDATLIGHSGWPTPGNTLQALRVAALLRNVHVDVDITSDAVPVVLRGRLERTTNGTGTSCAHDWKTISNLHVFPPSRDPAMRTTRGAPCTYALSNGTKAACTYRVPTLNAVFAEMPQQTRFMLQIDDHTCAQPCASCVSLAQRIKQVAYSRFIVPQRLTFVAKSSDTARPFMTALPDAKYVMDAGGEFAHYSSTSFVRLLVDNKWDGVSMTVALASWRPDLVQAVKEASAVRTSENLIIYAKPVRTSWQLKLGLCARIKRHVVIDVARMVRLLRYKSPPSR